MLNRMSMTQSAATFFHQSNLRITSSLIVAIALATCTHAQQASTGAKVAIIDVAYIFKNAETIQSEVKKLEAEMQQLQQFGQSKQEEMRREAKMLSSFKPDSPEYAQQEEKLASMESSLKLEAIRRRKSLAEAEAGLYFTNYQRLQQIVRQVAEFNKIDLVLRYDSEGMDIEQPDTVLRSVMKTVVYRAESIDLTQLVLQAMNQTQVARAPAATAQ